MRIYRSLRYTMRRRGIPGFNRFGLYALHRLAVLGLTATVAGVAYSGVPFGAVVIPLAVDAVACVLQMRINDSGPARVLRLYRSTLHDLGDGRYYRYGVLWTPVLRVFLIVAVCCGLGVLCVVVLDGPTIFSYPDVNLLARYALLVAGFRELATGWADMRIRQGL